PATPVELEFHFTGEDEQARMARQMSMPRYRGAAPAAAADGLVHAGHAARFLSSRHTPQHLAANEMEFALIGGQHVQPSGAGQTADDRPRLVATHLDRIENLVRNA